MSFSIQIVCQRFVSYYSTRTWALKTHRLCLSRNLSTVFESGSVIARPKELDQLKEKTKRKKEKEAGFNDEDIGLYGYFLLTIPVLTFGLGTWQVNRRQWKSELINDLQDRMSREPVYMPENLDDLKKLEFCPIKVRGKFLYSKEFLIGPRSLIVNGCATDECKGNLISSSSTSRGYNVVTPFKLENRDLIILVNRGWLPSKYKNLDELKKSHIDGIVEISGINRLTEVRPQFSIKNNPERGIWHYKDLEQMAQCANTVNIFLDMIESFPDEHMPVASQTQVNIRNEHLNYLMTWYSLSGLTGFYWYRMFILKKPIF